MLRTSRLFKRSVFFVDVMNVVLYSDLFIYHELIKRMEIDVLISSYFGNIPRFTKEQLANNSDKCDLHIIGLSASKKHQNILMDWIDKDKFIKYNKDITPEEFTTWLYRDIFTHPTCDEYIQLTEFGSTLKILVNDDNLF